MVQRSRLRDGRTSLSLATESGSLTVDVSEPLRRDGADLIGALVRVTGQWVAVQGNKGVVIGQRFVAPAATSIVVLTPGVPIADLPTQRIGEVVRISAHTPVNPQVKVLGIVTRAASGSLYITDSRDSIYVSARQSLSAQPGDVVQVVGFPEIDGDRPELDEAVYQVVGRGAVPEPTPVTAQQLMAGTHQARLVRLEGTVTGYEDSERRHRVILKDNLVAFQASVSRGEIQELAKWYPIGSRLAVVGVCSVDFNSRGQVESFRILLRSPTDLAMLQSPSWWTASRLLMLLGASGVVLLTALGWIGVLRRRLPRAELALQRSEARYQEIFERSPAGNSVSRVDGTIVTCNHRFAQILGFRDREQAMAINAIELYRDPVDREQFLEALARERRVEHYETTLLRADGSPVQVVESAVGRFDEAGKLVEIEGYVIDITQQKRAEAALHESTAQLRQAQRMEGMGRLAGGVAHDFNNLLTAILGYSELLLADRSLKASARADLEQIHRSGTSAASLTRQLLAFSRKQVLSPATLNLNEVVANVASMLRRVVGEDVSLSTVLTQQPAYVVADRGQIEQVLMNLAVNARDAMPGGGRLELSVSLTASNVLLAVRDTGCGIATENLPNIFEPFFTTKEVGKGTGLGLATVYGIVTQSGGSIDVQTREGKGTTFSISLPRFAPAEQTSGEMTQPPELRGRETVLVVEDEPTVRSLVRSTLERHGYTVVVAEDGLAAVHVLQQHLPHIDLVLSDVVMPQMSGPEFLSRAAVLKPDLKVLLMSGYSSHPGCQSPSVPAHVPFLQKPFGPGLLAATVRGVLDQAAPVAVH